MKILGIETSCDETSVAVLGFDEIKSKNQTRDSGSVSKMTPPKILSNVVSSQINVHKKYGGVVPEVAARKHVEHILPVLNQSLEQAGINNPEKEIDYIAVTSGPGLITSLFVGVEVAKTLSFAWQKPLVCIDHVRGHIYTNFLDWKNFKCHPEHGSGSSRVVLDPYTQIPCLPVGRRIGVRNDGLKIFPVIALVVSGGHTELVLMKDCWNWKKIGQTLDDAAGESFDKTAKILDEIIPGKVGYPGGPFISQLAKKGDKERFKLPRPMMNSNDFNFSFSGLKTAVLYLVRDNKEAFKYGDAIDICASFQQAVIDVLVSKTLKAAQKYKVKTIMLAGGVAANWELRNQMENTIKEKLSGVNFSMPEIKLCGDNGAATAIAGYYKILKKQFTPYNKVKVDPNLEI